MGVGQLVEAVEQPQHEVGVKGVVAGRAVEHQLGQRAVSLQPKTGLESVTEWIGHVNSLHPEDAVLFRAGLGP